MIQRLFFCLCIALTLLLTGCAGMPMTFHDDAERIGPNSKPIFLMTATFKNPYRPAFQQRLEVVRLDLLGANDKAEKNVFFVADKKGAVLTEAASTGNSYLVRMSLDNGRYQINGLQSSGSSFPFRSVFFTPMHTLLNVDKTGVFYLGHISATTRERQGNEFRAGSLIPLLDQAVGGASTGTFDIEISDNFEHDEKLFRDQFPALKNIEIKKAILPAFDRINAQRIWDAK